MTVSAWQPGTAYCYGDIVEFEGKYKIIQPHTSQTDWAPPVSLPYGVVSPTATGKITSRTTLHMIRPFKGDYHGQDVPQPTNYDQHPDQQENVPQQEQKKKWWDLDDDRKKQLEIGGGLLAGVAVLGAGYAAWHAHENKEKPKEEQQALVWGLQGWLRESQARTEEFRKHGPRAPTTWVLVEGRESIPRGAIEAGRDKDNNPIYIARAYFEDGLPIGKASPIFKEGAVIGYGGRVVEFNKFEVLLGDTRAIRWLPFRDQLNVQRLGARPVEGGREANGAPLYIARVSYHNGTHVAKIGEHLPAAHLAFGGEEVRITEYEVLCLN
ncbi:hypothetical protein BGW80DRAFT_1442655 [Lactifluus volemus]|nr:hypothetical protein BGW80DRAFT_1442655 [Lactifluus volemus]